MKSLTVDDVLKKSEVGTLSPLLVEVDNEVLPIIFVKDYLEVLGDLKDEVLVGLKSSIISNKKIDLFLVMLRFDNREDTTYDLWLNYGFQWHFEFLNALLKSNRILIDFRDEENNRVKTIELNNTIIEDLTKYKNECESTILVKEGKEENIIMVNNIKKYETWNNDEALELMDEVLEDYESIEDMWDNL